MIWVKSQEALEIKNWFWFFFFLAIENFLIEKQTKLDNHEIIRLPICSIRL